MHKTLQLFAAGQTGDKDSPIIFEIGEHIWWTRTSGTTKDLVVCVDCEGELCEMDSNGQIGVRPAMWIKL